MTKIQIHDETTEATAEMHALFGALAHAEMSENSDGIIALRCDLDIGETGYLCDVEDADTLSTLVGVFVHHWNQTHEGVTP